MKRTIHINDAYSVGSMPEGIEAVVPHRRAADALGVPRLTIEDMAWRRLYREGLRQADASERQLHLSKAVSEVIEPSNPAAVAGWLRPSVEALLRAGIDPSILEDDESERVRNLAKVAGVYLEALAGEKLVDPAEALWKAAGLGIGKRAILLWGYFRPRIDELEFIDALGGAGSRFILPSGDDPIFKGNREAAEFLVSRGWEIDRSAKASRTYSERVADGFLRGDVRDARAYFYQNIEAEARGVLAQIKKLLVDGVPSNEIVIAARNERLYGPVLEAIGWEYGVPVNLIYKIPIEETRFGGWVKLLLDAVAGGFDFEPVARLMKHSLGRGLPDDGWKRSRRAHTCGMDGWMEAGVDLTAINWPAEATRAEYTGLLLDALEWFEIRRRAAAWARELKAVNLFLASRASLLLADPERIVTVERFAGEVRDLLLTLTVDYQAEGIGVELHTPKSLFGARYGHVFAVGLADGIFPARIGQDPVLDYFERKRLITKGLRLDSAADVARREALSFYLLLMAATGRITFSYPQLIERESMLPSPYLKRMGISVEPANVCPPASLEEARRVFLRNESADFEDKVRKAAIHSLSVEEQRERPGSYDEYDGMTGRSQDADDFRWSVSQLTNIGLCPFKWFAHKILGIVEPEEMEIDLTPALEGRLYHKALELALKDHNEGDDPRVFAIDRLAAAFGQAESEIGIPRLPAWHAQRREHVEILRIAIMSPDFISEGAQVIGTEIRFNGEWFGLKIEGYIDRVDRTAEGIVMTDYKRGKTLPLGAKNSEGKAKIDLQLPIYIRAAGNALYAGQNITGRYYSLRKGKFLSIREKTDMVQLEEFASSVRARLKAGAFPVDPDVEFKACRYCEYDTVCRNGERLVWKVSER